MEALAGPRGPGRGGRAAKGGAGPRENRPIMFLLGALQTSVEAQKLLKGLHGLTDVLERI